MAAGGPGRKSKGDRALIGSRVPRVVYNAVVQESEDRAMSISEFVAAVLCEWYDRPDLQPMTDRTTTNEQELPLTG